jgi:diadenosine tetraphosphate (Ap4A) HIT family hydrolase
MRHDPPMATTDPLPLPDFVHWPIFPFVGDMSVRGVLPRRSFEYPRNGEPGGAPCDACAAPDEEFVWVDDFWRVRPPIEPSGAPVQVFLETREHLDLSDLDDDRAADMGRMIVRIERAILAVGDIARVHVNRWGDGGSHFHVWFYGRPVGDQQMIGFCLPLWAMTLPPTRDDEWNRNLDVIGAELAKSGGQAMR